MSTQKNTRSPRPDKAAFQRVASGEEKLFELNPNFDRPPRTDKGDLGAIRYSYKLAHRRITNGGWTHEVTERQLPNAKEIAGVNMRLEPGAYRLGALPAKADSS